MRSPVLFILLITSCLLCGCSLDLLIGKGRLSVPSEEVEPPAFEKSLIAQHTFSYAGTRSYELYKTQMGSAGTPSFMQWIPNMENETAGAVIVYYPYEGINWTGLTLDTKWDRPTGPQEDEDAPFYLQGTSSQITYKPFNHAAAATTNAVFFYNKLHVLIVYGRFYSGITPTAEVEVIRQAYEFLEQQPLVDKTKIGIYSGSWGGIGTLYGSAKSTIKPKAIGLAFPVSSPKDLVSYIGSIPSKTAVTMKQQQYLAYFDPYERRLNKATESLAGQPNRFDAWTYSALSSLASSRIFIMHDAWDTLVPVEQSTNLLASVPFADDMTYIQRHTSNIDYDSFVTDHYQSTNPLRYESQIMWLYTYLLTELTDGSTVRTTQYDSNVFVDEVTYMKAMYDAGQDTSGFDKVLAILCRPNLTMIDVSGSGLNGTGSDLLVYAMNNIYQPGWAGSGAAACAKLATDHPFTP